MAIVLAGHGCPAVLQSRAIVGQHGVAGVAGCSQAPGEVPGSAHLILHLQGAEQDVVVGGHLCEGRKNRWSHEKLLPKGNLEEICT